MTFIFNLKHIHSVSNITHVFRKWVSEIAKVEADEVLKIKEFTLVNDCFQRKSNEEISVFWRALYKVALLVFALMAGSNISHASNEINFVIISGQVVNLEYGNPIDKHVVFIESISVVGDLSDYSNAVLTNSQGYYYDTIYTTEDKGSFAVFTDDYSGKTIDTTVYFRFMDRASRVLIADFNIYMPYQAEKLQARFKYVQKQGDDRMNYSFLDQTSADNIIGWLWDFGDGSFSNLQNTQHLYQSHGLFKITLTVTASVDNVIKTSVISKQIYITDRIYYHLGGHVFSEYFPIDLGSAYLYMIDVNNSHIAIDTVAFDTLGYYYFYEVPAGKYVIKAEPMCESQYYGTLLPTYYGNSLFWDESVTVSLTSTSWEYNIQLRQADGFLPGEGKISGNVVYDNLPRSVKNYSAEGVNLFLYNDSDELLTCHYTDHLGDFSFDMVELNSYWLYAEITGVETEKIKVELTEENPVVDNIEIIIFSNSVSYVVPNEDPNSNDIVGLPYPNPVSHTLKIPLSLNNISKASYEIYNMYGQMIRAGKVDVLNIDNVFEVSIGGIKNGSYILCSKINDKNYDRYFIVAK